MGTRRTPTFLGETQEPLPERTREGFWSKAMNEVFVPNPGKVFVFGDVSPSTASNLRREYGLDAYTVSKNGQVEVRVQYDPDRVEAIKAAVAQRGEKRKATIAKNKAEGKVMGKPGPKPKQ